MFYAGQTVRVLDTEEIREWTRGREVIGKTFVLDSETAKRLNDPKRAVHFDNNHYNINFYSDMVEVTDVDWDK